MAVLGWVVIPPTVRGAIIMADMLGLATVGLAVKIKKVARHIKTSHFYILIINTISNNYYEL